MLRLDANLREDFEERAGIIEFDANEPREHAECLALLDVLKRHPAALIGVTALQVNLDGETHCVLTTDVDLARKHLADLGTSVIGVVDLATAVKAQFGGMALLTQIDLRKKRHLI